MRLSGSLGEREIMWELLWEHKLQASVSTAFLSPPKLSWVYNSIETQRMCFVFLLETIATKKGIKNNLLQLCNFDHENVNSLCSRYHHVNGSIYT